jgi:Fe-S-cluster containining protein
VKITPSICQRCGACCSSVLNGELVACRHLSMTVDSYRCSIYATRPQVCRDYSCVRDGQLSEAVAARALIAMELVA